MERTLFHDIAELEEALRLPPAFYQHLLQEDDWSFIIKLNALFEAACTKALVARFSAPEAAESIAQLDLANSKHGKVALLGSTAVLNKTQVSILRKLAELRNAVVHNIEQVAFSFDQYVAGLDANQFKEIVRTFGHSVIDPVPVGTTPMPRAQFVRFNPKLSLWLSAAEVLACLQLQSRAFEISFSGSRLATYQALAAAKGQPTPERGK